MIKNILRILVGILALTTMQASAQALTGSWSLLPSLGNVYSEVVETDDRTYFLAGGFLLSIENDGSETYFYNRANKLSDNAVNLIRYNYEKNYLFIAYTNGNIDLLYDDGRVVNMPEFRDAALTTSHNILDVAFGADRIALATEFGIVIYNDERHEVVESGMYGQKVTNVLILGETLLILTNNDLLYSPLATRHSRLDTFTQATRNNEALRLWPTAMAKTDDTHFMYLHLNNKILYYVSFDPATGVVVFDSYTSEVAGKCVSYGKDYFAISSNNSSASANQICTFFSKDGTVENVTIPADLRGYRTFSTMGKASVWIAKNNTGISRYNLSETTPEVLLENFQPEAVSVGRPSVFNWSADGSKLYISDVVRSNYIENNLNTKIYISALNADGSISQAGVPSISNGYRATVDINDSDRLFVGYGYNGIGVFKNGEQQFFFDKDTYPIPKVTTIVQVHGSFFDPEGNLWICCFADDGVVPIVVLKAEAVGLEDLSAVTAADWLSPKLPTSFAIQYEPRMVFHSTKPYAVMASSKYASGYVVLNHKGTYTDFDDDVAIHHSSITDQSGASLGESSISCLVEDKNGRIWFGTKGGIFVMDDPAAAMDPQQTLRRPLVARNDGTNFGDYLLSTDVITGIAIDHTNRKWITTSSSGIYLVSADGDEILEHFTPNNSPLPTNKVYSVTVNPNNSEVYFGTDAGVFVYNGTSSPAADDYSEVIAYPNPVRPEYTGWVTITGLMQDSLVKITDAVGNVVFTGNSEGGTMVWDVCNSAGERVRAGVYFVMASQNTNGNTGAVAKILVIN